MSSESFTKKFTKEQIHDMREQAGYAIAYINGVMHYLHLLNPKRKDKIKTILDNSPPIPRKVSESITLASTLQDAIKNYKKFKKMVESFAVLNTTHGRELPLKPEHEAVFAPAEFAPDAFAPAPASAYEFAPASAFPPSARGGRKTGRKSGRKTGRKTYKRRH